MALLVHRPSSGYLVPQRISVAEQPAPGHSAAEQRDFRASGRGVPVGVQHREPPLHDLYGRSEVTVCDEFLSFRQVGLRCLPLFIVILLSFYCHFIVIFHQKAIISSIECPRKIFNPSQEERSHSSIEN